MARQIADDMRGSASYLDLESAVDRRKLDDPEAYFAANRDKLIIIDEIQRAPEIFQVLRGEIDARRRQNGKGGSFFFWVPPRWTCCASPLRALQIGSALLS